MQQVDQNVIKRPDVQFPVIFSLRSQFDYDIRIMVCFLDI